jgi:hypothetical protein
MVSWWLTGGSWGTEGGDGGVDMRSWELGRTTSGTDVVVPEPAADAGVGSGGTGSIEGRIGGEGCSERLAVVRVGPETPGGGAGGAE